MSDGEIDTQTPLIDMQTVERMEKGASSQGTGQSRRMCLLSLSKSLEDLNRISKESEESRELFNILLKCAKDFRDHAGALLEIAEKAVLRLELSDEYADTAAVLAGVKEPKQEGGKA